MPQLNFDKAKYSCWKGSHNFKTCKLNRKEYGEYLTSYITGEKDGFVLNLNGSWGSGKTEFLKRMYTALLQRNSPCIYIDAWESDFSKDPLTVVTSELLSQLELLNYNFNSEKNGRQLKEAFTKVIRASLIGISGGLTKFAVGDAGIGIALAQSLQSNPEKNFLDNITGEYQLQIEAIRDIRKNLADLAETISSTFSANLPVVVLIDELDRCRPTYAIEMLEVIKHFFNTNNFVFVVATDTEQLSHSIKAVYGQDFESKIYLKRFFDRKASLPIPDIKHYLHKHNIDYSEFKKLDLFPKIFDGEIDQSINQIVSYLSSTFELSIRDVDQLLNKFKACLRSALNGLECTQRQQHISYPALLIGLIEQDKFEEIYISRSTEHNPIHSELKNYKISEKFSTKKLIHESMKNITLTSHSIPSSHGSGGKIKRLPTRSDYSHELRDCECPLYNSFINNSLEHIKYQHHSPESAQHKFWLWDDMKKAIELAGTIE